MNLAPLYKPIEKDLAKVEEELGRQLRSNNKFVSRLGAHILKGAGKRLRPALLILSAKAASANDKLPRPKESPDILHHQLVQLATAVELIHSATLVHDDVIDEALLRRKRASLNRKWGDKVSILFGDYLHSSAFAILSHLNMPEIMSQLSSVIKSMCEGEIMQIRMCFNPHLAEREYLSIVHQKTASLLSFSSESGARLAKASSPQIETLSAYGMNFGMAFQIIDDYLDLVGEEGKAGKSLGSDLRKGKLTLPLIHLLSLPGRKIKKEVLSLLSEENGHNRLKEMAKEKGSLDYTLKIAKAYIEKAKEKISALRRSSSREGLLSLADYVVARV